jgi:signal recognition particle receptor subunit beta
MVFFNYALRKLNAKIVYYGPGLCGKTTNLVWIHDHFEGGERGKMISLATEGDRTIFFDLLPLEIGTIRGMDVTLQLYTVPGQVHYNSTRQLVLRGADGVVFVGDSQRAMQSSNIDSFKNLQENLLLQGISLDGFPHVLQFNKRDLKDIVPAEELNDELNHYSVPIFEAVATEGVGVQETLEGIVKLVMRNLRQRYEGKTTGARTPGLEDSQVDVHEPPPTPPPVEPVVPPGEPAEPVAVSEPPPAAEPAAPPEEPVPIFDPEPPPPGAEPEPPPAEPEPPPVEATAPPEEPLEEITFEPEELTVEEPSAPAEPPAAEEPPPEAPPEPSPEPMPAGDPAETVDFSKASGSDPFGGLGGGFEDEVSTAVYDVNDDSAIDFDELKKLDEQPGAATPPPPPEAPEAAPPAFDLDSTDAGAKTQDAIERDPKESMAAFDFDAPAPDMDSIPDFELDEPEPRPPRVKAAQEAPPPSEPEVTPPPAFEPESTPPPVAEPESVPAPSTVPEAPSAAAAAPPPVPAEGRYEDRIEAPSPFAPKSEAPAAAAAPSVADETPAEGAAQVPPEEPVAEEMAAVPEAPPAEIAQEAIEEPEIEFIDEGAEAAIDVSARAAEEEQLFEATPAEPVVVGSEEPWTEEELSGVYDLEEVEKAERAAEAAAIEAAVPRPVDVRAEDNQLHLRLQGTGAIVESGQVRALDIEVPVPGSWVGNRRVTLQLRLTLTPDTEVEDDGHSPS